MSRSRSSAKAVQFKHESEEEEEDEEEQLPSRRMHSYGDAAAIGSGVPAFLAKLWRLVDDADTNRLICWTKVSLRRHIVYLPFQGLPSHHIPLISMATTMTWPCRCLKLSL